MVFYVFSVCDFSWEKTGRFENSAGNPLRFSSFLFGIFSCRALGRSTWGKFWVYATSEYRGLYFGESMVNYPIGSMYGIYANIGGILMVNVTIYSIHGSYGYDKSVNFRGNIFFGQTQHAGSLLAAIQLQRTIRGSGACGTSRWQEYNCLISENKTANLRYHENNI
jgi:hypothetical protein